MTERILEKQTTNFIEFIARQQMYYVISKMNNSWVGLLSIAATTDENDEPIYFRNHTGTVDRHP